MLDFGSGNLGKGKIMNITLNKLKIENFKGIKSHEIEPEGANITITAENAGGKTTLKDAFGWTLHGKNSEGKVDSGAGKFEVGPVDENNQPIRGLTTLVEIELAFDGVAKTFKKVRTEKLGRKKTFKGYNFDYWIDDVTKTLTEYKAEIVKFLPENTLKLLTDLTYFNNQLHWEERRKIIEQLVGETESPQGFDELLANLKGRSIKDFKKILSEQKEGYEKELSKINPRIDEVQRALKDYAGTDTKDLDTCRDTLKDEIAALDEQRQILFDTEKERQGKIKLINKLEGEKVKREAELKTDTTGIKDLLAEKTKLEVDLAEINRAVTLAKSDLATRQTILTTQKATLVMHMSTRNAVYGEWKEASEALEAPVAVDDTCFACSQKLPADQVANQVAKVEEKCKTTLAEITKRGDDIKAKVDSCGKSIAEQEKSKAHLNEILEEVKSLLQKAEQDKTIRFAEIDRLVKAYPGIKPSEDKACKDIYNGIIEARKLVGESLLEQLQAIDTQRTDKNKSLALLNEALAQADQMKKSKARIAELEAKEKELAQNIADCEKQLADIDDYKIAESKILEQAVNSKFHYVTFKMHGEFLNGEPKPCCEALLDGKGYIDMSGGERIFASIDIINTLSDHYGIWPVLFIDNREMLSLSIETKAQVISLKMVKGVKELTIEKEGD